MYRNFFFGTNAGNKTEKFSNVQNKKQSWKWGWVPDMISVICAYRTCGPEDSSSAQRSKHAGKTSSVSQAIRPYLEWIFSKDSNR